MDAIASSVVPNPDSAIGAPAPYPRIGEIVRLQGEIGSRCYAAKAGSIERYALRRQTEALRAELRDLTERLRRDLAIERGWIIGRTPFSLSNLATGRRSDRDVQVHLSHGVVDHAECFRQRARPYRPVALLTHSYNAGPEEFVAVARKLGLAVELLDWSWYYPGHCNAALFIRI